MAQKIGTFFKRLWPGGEDEYAGKYTFADCKEASKINLPKDSNETAYKFLEEIGAREVAFYYKGEAYDGMVYGADYYPLLVSRDCPDSLKTRDECVQIQGKDGRLFFDTTKDAIKLIRNNVVKNAKDGDRLEYSRKNVFNYVCNEETKDKPFDTKILFMGVDFMNPKYMVFFVVFGIILSFFAYLSKFR